MAAWRTALTVMVAVVAPTIIGGALSHHGSASASAEPPATPLVATTTTAERVAVPSTTSTTPNLASSPATASASIVAPVAVLDRIAVWYALADCETGVWSANKVPVPGSARWSIVARGYQGGLQFHPSTWDRNRRPDDPEDADVATPAQQIAVGEIVLARQGVKAWPLCGPRVGLGALLAAAPTAPDDGFPAGDPTVVYEGSIGGVTPP